MDDSVDFRKSDGHWVNPMPAVEASIKQIEERLGRLEKLVKTMAFHTFPIGSPIFRLLEEPDGQ